MSNLTKGAGIEAGAIEAVDLPPLPKGDRADEYTGSTLVYGARDVVQYAREAIAHYQRKQASQEGEQFETMDHAQLQALGQKQKGENQ